MFSFLAKPVPTPLQGSEWKQKPAAAISCLVFPHPQTLPSLQSPMLPIFLPQLLFWLSDSQVSPQPPALYTPVAPLWPSVTPHAPPHPPSPKGKPTAFSPLCLPLPPHSTTSASSCLCVWEASKGSEESWRGGGKNKRWILKIRYETRTWSLFILTCSYLTCICTSSEVSFCSFYIKSNVL